MRPSLPQNQGPARFGQDRLCYNYSLTRVFRPVRLHKCQNAHFSPTTANGPRLTGSGYACKQRMAGPCSRGAAPRAAINSRSVTNEPSGTPTKSGFPKSARILRTSDFRKAYTQGTRIAGPYFAAFCLQVPRSENAGPRLGFTVPRAFGKAVTRNRVKRRLRETLRIRLMDVGPQWDIVINPRRAALTASPAELRREVDRLVKRCAK